MIRVERNDPSVTFRSEHFRCVIDLKGTAAAVNAPYGTGVDSPHALGYGGTVRGAIDDAWRNLGEYIGMIEAPKEDSNG